MIDRKTDIGLVRTALRRTRVVALLGPRQCGKSTLARQFVPADSLNYFDLEDHPGERRYALADGIEAIPLHELACAKGDSASFFKKRHRYGAT